MKTTQDMIAEAKSLIQEIDSEQAKALIEQGAKLLDVRDANEFVAGAIDGACHISRGMLEFVITDHPQLHDRTTPIIVYCKSGGRSALACCSLQQLGYTNIYSLQGGILAWHND